jgi:hypothetical protein
MPVNLSPLGGAGAQFFDNSGIPLAGGLIYTYEAGTTTPAATYTSSSGATPHANPIVLDAAGRVTGGEIWITTILLYKFILKTSAGVTIATYDNIGLLGIATSGANSNITSLSGLTTPLSEAQGGTGTTTGYYGFKNRIINGGMVIDQRNAGASVTVDVATTVFGVDRFFGWGYAAAGVFTIQQSTTAPAGFKNSTKITVTTADASLGTTKFYTFGQFIEGLNTYDFKFGTSGASTVTLSFWVQSSIPGAYSATILNTSFSRGYTASFTINAANTWQQVSLVIAGDITGTWATDNTSGIRLWISLGSGSTYTGTANTWNAGSTYAASGQVNLISTVSATMYITGVQIEKGATATSFDYRPYGTELSLCQRYLPATTGNYSLQGQCATSTQAYLIYKFPVTTRVPPTGISTAGGIGQTITNSAFGNVALLSIAFSSGETNSGMVYCIVTSGLTAGNATTYSTNGGQLLFTGCEL